MRSCSPGLRLVEHLEHGGDVVYRHACRLGCEGILSKRLGGPRRPILAAPSNSPRHLCRRLHGDTALVTDRAMEAWYHPSIA
jgi:hypothetical protein